MVPHGAGPAPGLVFSGFHQYFSHQPRPDFANKHKDWPKDKKPADARY